MVEYAIVKIKKFKDQYFGLWRMQIEDYLYQEKLYEPLTGLKPRAMKQEEWELLGRQTIGVIMLILVKNVAYNIVNGKTA